MNTVKGNKVARFGLIICLLAMLGFAWTGRRREILGEFRSKAIKLRPVEDNPGGPFAGQPKQFWMELDDRDAAFRAIKSAGYHREREPLVPTSEPLSGTYSNRNPILRFLPSHSLEIEVMPYVGYKLSFFE